MTTMTTTTAIPAAQLLTADDLYALPDDYRHELVRGKLITMPPPGFMRGVVTGRFGLHIANFVHQNDLPYVGGFQPAAYIEQDPDTIRASDYGIYSRRQIPDPLPDCPYIPGLIPELVVEVIEPDYGNARAANRAQMWLDAGVGLVVMAYIASRAIVTHARDGTERRFALGDALTLAPTLPGFAVPVADIFAF